jgi:hypothetical protein
MRLTLFIELAKVRPAVRQKEMVVVVEIHAALFGGCNPPVTFHHAFVPRLVGSVDVVHPIAKAGGEPALTTELSIQFMPAIWTRPTRHNLSLFLFHSRILSPLSGNCIASHLSRGIPLSIERNLV